MYRKWRTRRKPEVRELCDRLAAQPDQPGRPSILSRTVMKVIGVYQRYSAGKDRCSFGPERNCSKLGRRAVSSLGPVAGIKAMILIALVSPHMDHKGPDGDDCCGPG